ALEVEVGQFRRLQMHLIGNAAPHQPQREWYALMELQRADDARAEQPYLRRVDPIRCSAILGHPAKQFCAPGWVVRTVVGACGDVAGMGRGRAGAGVRELTGMVVADTGELEERALGMRQVVEIRLG